MLYDFELWWFEPLQFLNLDQVQRSLKKARKLWWFEPPQFTNTPLLKTL